MRLELRGTVRQELITDLFFSINLFESFDSKPQAEGAKRNDFGITTALGWSF